MAKKSETTKKSRKTSKSKSVELGVRDRIILSEMMRSMKRGTFLELLVGKHIIQKVSFGPEETDQLAFKEENNMIKWDVSKEKKRNISFTETELSRIDNVFQKLGSMPDSLTIDHMALWEKFGFEEPEIN